MDDPVGKLVEVVNSGHLGFDNHIYKHRKVQAICYLSLFHDQTSTSSAEKEAKLHAVKQQLPSHNAKDTHFALDSCAEAACSLLIT